jgi:hypothetical protein
MLNKKGFGVNQNPLFSFYFPSTALPVSGSMSIFSGYPFEPPQKKRTMNTRKNHATKRFIVYGLRFMVVPMPASFLFAERQAL